MPQVSICIPAYEQVRYLERTLASVAEQTHRDHDVILSDDSSSDAVEQLVQRMSPLFGERLRYVRNKPALGSPGNWNSAIRSSTGSYVKIMHHDEWFTAPDALERMVNAMEQHRADVVVSGIQVEVESTGYRWTLLPESPARLAVEASPAQLLLANTIGPPSAMLYRRSVGSDFDPTLKYLVDVDFYMRLLQSGAKFHWMNEALIGSVSDAGHNVTLDCMRADVEMREYLLLLERHRSSIPVATLRPFEERVDGLFLKYGIDTAAKLKEACPHWNGRPSYRKAMLRAGLIRRLRRILGKDH